MWCNHASLAACLNQPWCKGAMQYEHLEITVTNFQLGYVVTWCPCPRMLCKFWLCGFIDEVLSYKLQKVGESTQTCTNKVYTASKHMFTKTPSNGHSMISRILAWPPLCSDSASTTNSLWIFAYNWYNSPPEVRTLEVRMSVNIELPTFGTIVC